MSAFAAVPDQSAKIGALAMRRVTGGAMESILSATAARSPRLASNLVAHAFGSVIADAGLGVAERELETIAMLGALGGCEAQLRTHIGFALDCGLSPAEVMASAEHVSVYAGYPRALTMARLIEEVVSERGESLLTARAFALRDHTTALFDSGGEKPPMVLLHALGLDWRMWSGVIPHLVPHHRVIALDLRGFGTAAGAPQVADLAHYAADIADLLDRLGIERAHVTGLSLGGSIVLELGLQRPDLVRDLTMIAATAWSFPAFEERAQAAENDGLEAQIAPSLTRWFRPGDLARNDWPTRYARNCVGAASPEEWAAAWRVLATLSLEDRLDRLEPRLSLIAGEVDRSTPPELMRRLAPDVAVIPDAPHMIALTHPEELAQAILAG
ncbi:alpha/beta hydrolase [Alteriqipengyuania sp. 357]